MTDCKTFIRMAGGASGPYKVLAEKFGFTVENVYAAAKKLI